MANHLVRCSGMCTRKVLVEGKMKARRCRKRGYTETGEWWCSFHETQKFKRREPDTGRCESCNGLHSDCGEA